MVREPRTDRRPEPRRCRSRGRLSSSSSASPARYSGRREPRTAPSATTAWRGSTTTAPGWATVSVRGTIATSTCSSSPSPFTASSSSCAQSLISSYSPRMTLARYAQFVSLPSGAPFGFQTILYSKIREWEQRQILINGFDVELVSRRHHILFSVSYN